MFPDVWRETEADRPEVYELIKRAFETAEHCDGDEQDHAVGLRAGDGFIPELSLVAEADGTLVGHIMLTGIFVVRPDGSRYAGVLVSPLSVAAEWRNIGIGAALVREGLRIAREMGCGAAFLVGDPDYYGRFGFRRADGFGIHPVADIPPQFVMACEITPGALDGVTGTGDFI